MEKLDFNDDWAVNARRIINNTMDSMNSELRSQEFEEMFTGKIEQWNEQGAISFKVKADLTWDKREVEFEFRNENGVPALYENVNGEMLAAEGTDAQRFWDRRVSGLKHLHKGTLKGAVVELCKEHGYEEVLRITMPSTAEGDGNPPEMVIEIDRQYPCAHMSYRGLAMYPLPHSQLRAMARETFVNAHPGTEKTHSNKMFWKEDHAREVHSNKYHKKMMRQSHGYGEHELR